MLKKCSHKNITKFIDYFDESHYSISKSAEEVKTYLVVEFLPDGELYDKITEQKFITEIESRSYLKQVFEALRYLLLNVHPSDCKGVKHT